MKKFAHFGAVVHEKMDGMNYLASLGVWVSDPANDPNTIEYLYFDENSPMKETPVAKGGHIAFLVDNIDEQVQGKNCCWGPMDAVPGVRIAFFTDEFGTLTEYCQC
ncbi:MAG: hypothetical protein Q4D98_11430 [Planctomycetia bacterium]|nr:hypothetical protein [Planctomycetia bacterium]